MPMLSGVRSDEEKHKTNNNRIPSRCVKLLKALRHLSRQSFPHTDCPDNEIRISKSYKQKARDKHVHNLFVYKTVYPNELSPHAHHIRSEEHTSELQSRQYLVCRLLLEEQNSRSWLFCTTPS